MSRVKRAYEEDLLRNPPSRDVIERDEADLQQQAEENEDGGCNA